MTLDDVSDGSELLERAQRVADDVLFPRAQIRDRAALLPADGLEALADAGLFAIAGPPAPGDDALDVATVRRIMAAVGSGCGATFFVWVQHHGVVRSLATSPNTALADRLLPALCRGEHIAGIAFAHVRRAGRPAVRATRTNAGWRLDGRAPWATSWGIADHFSISAVTDENPDDGRDDHDDGNPDGNPDGNAADRRLVRVIVPGRRAGHDDSPALDATALSLPVFASTGTVVLDFDGLEVSDADVIDVQPLTVWQAADRVSAALGQPAVLGVADRATQLLIEHPDTDARSAGERLRRELGAAWRRDDELLAALAAVGTPDHPVPAGDASVAIAGDASVAIASDHRAACLHLARRATTAFLAASGGGGMDLAHPAQRLMREADFYVIQAQTADGRAATLRSV